MSKRKLYDVVTLYDCMQDPATVAWLVHIDVPLPATTPAGRYPTPSEIQQVIEDMLGIRADYVKSDTVWQVTVRSKKDVFWGNLAVLAYSGDPDEPHHIVFTDGWDEIIQLVTSHLAKRCGPLVLMHDSGAAPQVIL